MPMTQRGKKRVLDDLTLRRVISTALALGNCTCVLEDVGRHMVGNNAQSSATFAYTCGMTHGVVSGCGVKVELVTPRVWQSWLGIASGGDKAKRKGTIKAEVQRRFPEVKVINDTADALGIYAFAVGQL